PPNLPGIERMLGLFINTLPVRVRIPEGTRLLPWLKEIQAEQFTARGYDYAPLTDVQSWSEVPRGQSLFQSIVVIDNTPERDMASGMGAKLVVESFGRTQASAGYPVAFLASPGKEIELKLIYDESRFDAATVERMLGHLGTLLRSMIANPEGQLEELEILTAEERRLVVEEWNATAVDYPRDASVSWLFEAQAARTPEAVAVVFEDSQLTYRQLDERSNQLAHHLHSLGVRHGARVGLCLERSLDMVVATLGILKAGAAYVPLDASYPAERLGFMLQEASVSVLLTQGTLGGKLPSLGEQRVRLDTDWDQIASRPTSALPSVGTTGDSLAYIMFTSGSTGRPKGVCIPHRGISRLVLGSSFIRFDSQQVFLQLAPIAFDASTLELWGALLHGAKLVVFPPQQPSLESIAQALHKHGITTLWLTAALFEQMVLHQSEALARVAQVLAGGDVLPVVRVRELLARGAPLVVNGYGPTENTTFTCCHPVTSASSLGSSVPVGRPISNTQVYVLDAHRQPVPVGVPGELFTGGDGLALGYLNNPELTAERFVTNPFGPPGSRLYRTGDKVRWLPDGSLEFLGRVDFQVKIRGFRIELGEIESLLLQHPSVQEATVLAREDVPGDKRLVAYLVGDEDVSTDTLRDYLRNKLPEYMVPSAFVALASMPLSPNGKVDRRALPAPEAPVSSGEAFVSPRNPTEQQLADIWAEVLRLPRVGTQDDFFDIGGHSLLATQIVSRVRAAFDVDLPLGQIFESPTIATLAAHIDSVRSRAAKAAATPASAAASAPAIVPVSREGELPLSFAQQRLWFLDQLQPGGATYNLPAPVRLSGALHVAALEQSLGHLLQRHEALRTTFPSVRGE
ncbi:MAG TPA: amino acid adenylation domain-containing protein, partial [Myxococcaceae bacterium]|nr:amino acid adenylation domain-containing protein [Myxococcaceae bacterium]